MLERRLSRALPLLAALLTGCAPSVPAAAPAPADARADVSRWHVLLVNGGGTPSINHETHLAQLRAMREALLEAGVPEVRITLLSGDGADPAPDLAARDPAPGDHHWLLRGSRQDRALGPPRVLRSSEIPGAKLGVASKAELGAWFDAARARIGAGDTLLLFVTDHGSLDRADPLGNTILLWKREKLTVRDLGALIDQLDPGVRVVSLMSHCYAGAFAALSTRASADGRPRARFCGYFAAPADRPSYGCSSEHRRHDLAGHALRFIDALRRTRSLREAHAATLLEDDAPDAPLTSTDVYLEGLVKKAASERGVTFDALVEDLLGASAPDPAAAEDRARIDRLAASFGLDPPRTFADVTRLQKALPDLERDLEGAGKSWRGAWTDAAADNVKRFLASSPTWNEKLGDQALKSADPTAVRALAAPFLADLRAFTAPDRNKRIELYRDRTDAAAAAVFRAETRLAATLRARTWMVSRAGRALLARSPADDRATFDALHACEDLRLPGPASPRTTLAPPTALAPLADDERIHREIRPAWMGFNTIDVPAELRRKQKLADGAAAVSAVYPDSPAAAAGVEVGDVLLGPPGQAFSGHGDVRGWAMLAPLAAPAPLEIRRGDDRLTLTLTPRPLPRELPPLPPALTVGRTAPTLHLRAYRGEKVNLQDGKPHLLMFWATWCAPCKKALPELLAFERERKVQVVAITDEETATLDTFFKTFKGPFAKAVAIDDLHRSFDVFGVRTRPLFVLLDEKGTVVARTVGYEAAKGLGFEGWKWKGK